MKPFLARWLSLITISVPLLFQILWQIAANAGHNQAERVRLFMRYFDGLFTETAQVTQTNLIFCVLTIAVCIWSLKIAKGPARVMNIFWMVLASMLLLLNLFSLM